MSYYGPIVQCSSIDLCVRITCSIPEPVVKALAIGWSSNN